MTEDSVNKRASEIVNELIVYNKIKMSVKNIWAEKIIDFLLNEKTDYNLFQHSKIMKSIPSIPANEGIAQLLEMFTNVNSVPEENMLEEKKSELPVKEQWKVDFNYMTFAQQYEKACGWLSCGCPERAIPVFIMDWVKCLAEEKQIAEMREKYKIGRRRSRVDDFKVSDTVKKIK
jgi:hypothetical protein